jgi:hypothetical protein
MHRSFYIPDTASPPQRSPNLVGGLVQARRDNCFSGCVEGELLQQQQLFLENFGIHYR